MIKNVEALFFKKIQNFLRFHIINIIIFHILSHFNHFFTAFNIKEEKEWKT